MVSDASKYGVGYALLMDQQLRNAKEKAAQIYIVVKPPGVGKVVVTVPSSLTSVRRRRLKVPLTRY